MKKTALITGISGQDGAYLAKFLLKKKYKVIGVDRRSSRTSKWRLKKLGIDKKIIFDEMEITETHDIIRIFKKYNIKEVYNLAAQSFVGSSFNCPIYTSEVTGISVMKILEVIKNHNKKIKFYQASSSEMFGDVLEKKQNELTGLNPQSPYAIAKCFAHYTVNNYRKAYNIFAVSGILFNHESPLRGEEFVTRKITLGLSRIFHGKGGKIKLGNIYAKRDWGFAEDYVEAMWKFMQLKRSENFVIATGKTYSIKNFIDECTKYLGWKCKWKGKGLNEKLLKDNIPIIEIDKKYFRPAEVNLLQGDTKKAKKKIRWTHKTNFKKLVKLMMKSDLEYIKLNKV